MFSQQVWEPGKLLLKLNFFLFLSLDVNLGNVSGTFEGILQPCKGITQPWQGIL